MKWSDFDKYLKGDHLGGKEVTVIIDRVVIEETHPKPGPAVQVPVMYFRGARKGLILSQTNRNAIASLFGDDAGACVGKMITLKAVPSRDGAGREVSSVRIFAAKTNVMPLPKPATNTELSGEDAGGEGQ